MDVVEIASAHGRAQIGTHGAQVLEAELDDRRLLWLSPLANTESGAAIRGGVPICFPWFGKHPDGLPAHGFARNRTWRLTEHVAGRAAFALDDDAATLALWPYAFHADLTVTIDDALRLEFAVTNTGTGPFAFTYALHTYFAVGEATECRVDGLDGRARREVGHPTAAQVGEVAFDQPVDAIFERAPGRVVLREAHRGVAIDTPDMTSAVVWNPGPNDVPDIGDGWRHFVCVERGRIGEAAVTLGPGERHATSMRLSLL